MDEPNVSALIVNWNTKEHLRQCLYSLTHHASRITPEVIVVDNASVDGSAEMVQKEFPQTNLIANELNIGYATANNQVAELAKGRYFCCSTLFKVGALKKFSNCCLQAVLVKGFFVE